MSVTIYVHMYPTKLIFQIETYWIPCYEMNQHDVLRTEIHGSAVQKESPVGLHTYTSSFLDDEYFLTGMVTPAIINFVIIILIRPCVSP